MIGAILGDMIGAPYEFDRGDKTKEFPLFSRESEFTDDTVMTVAVAEAWMDSFGKSDEEIKAALVSSMRKWGRRYPYAGYGGMFLSLAQRPGSETLRKLRERFGDAGVFRRMAL